MGSVAEGGDIVVVVLGRLARGELGRGEGGGCVVVDGLDVGGGVAGLIA